MTTSNYPPGVTGSEPEITGEWPHEFVADDGGNSTGEYDSDGPTTPECLECGELRGFRAHRQYDRDQWMRDEDARRNGPPTTTRRYIVEKVDRFGVEAASEEDAIRYVKHGAPYGVPVDLLTFMSGGEYRIDTIKTRLEELRAILRSESISYGEMNELQSLAPYIESGDVELLEPAGIPEAYAYAPNPYEAAFPYGEDSLHCDYCDVIEYAGDLTDDWNGETGNHLSCEANIKAHRA